MDDCIFCKIVRREIPKEFAYEDDDILAFDDLYPKAPIHLIIIPKQHIADFFEVEDDKIHVKISHAIKKLIEEKGLDKKGYKVVVNGGGYQDIFHLHFHLTGPLKSPLKA